jgi:predicted  nucleic acid-binding Zn-ribbon protein
MRVKVYPHGVGGYQLAHLHPDDSIKNVRPGTAEEYYLYEKLRQHMKITSDLYNRAKTAEDKLRTALTPERAEEYQAEIERLTAQALGRAEAYQEHMSACDKEISSLREEISDLRSRAEAAEEALLESDDERVS